MLTADQRNAVAEFLLVHFDQARPVGMFLRRHLLEYLGGMRKVAAQHVGIGEVDPGIVLFGRNGQGQHFLLRQRVEGTFAEAENTGEHWVIPF